MKQAKAPSNSQVENAKTLYDWQRFWVARTSMLDLSDGGFLADPTSPLRRSHPATPATLAELAKYRALVLLGEPGIGKSTTLEAEAARVSADPVANSTTSIHVDLRAYSSDALLHQRLFGSPEFIAWTTGNSHLVLHLDSLDEALLRIDSIANLLAGELPRYPTSRMSVRIACRTAVWPGAILEPVLNGLWGNDAVGVFELAPLRRNDVVAAATAHGIDADTFIREMPGSERRALGHVGRRLSGDRAPCSTVSPARPAWSCRKQRRWRPTGPACSLSAPYWAASPHPGSPSGSAGARRSRSTISA
jgi:hypothetical protein